MEEDMSSTVDINGRMVGDGAPAYIIAEMSANHAAAWSAHWS